MPTVGSHLSVTSMSGRSTLRGVFSGVFSGVSLMLSERKERRTKEKERQKVEQERQKVEQERQKADREYLENTPITGYATIKRGDGTSVLDTGKWAYGRKTGYEDQRSLLKADKIEMDIIKKLIPFDRDVNEILKRLEKLPSTDTLPEEMQEQLKVASAIRNNIADSLPCKHLYFMDIIIDNDAIKSNKIPLAQRILRTYLEDVKYYSNQNISITPVFNDENLSFKVATSAEIKHVLEHRPIWEEAGILQKICHENSFLDPDNKTLKDADKIRLERLSMHGDIPADERPDDTRSPLEFINDIYKTHGDLKLYREIEGAKKEQADARKNLHAELLDQFEQQKQERARQEEVIPVPDETHQMLYKLWNELEARDLVIPVTDEGITLKQNDALVLGKGACSQRARRKDIARYVELAKRMRDEYAPDLKFDHED